jgi:hypothetical protein
MLIIRADNRVVIKAKYALDEKQTPPAIDLESQGQTTPGIYELKGNTLRLCLGREKTRPMAFVGSQDAMFLVLERGQSNDKRSLKQAVASFNQEAARNSIGRAEPPLTEDEVVAALRGWDRKQMEVDDPTYAIFQKIADSRNLPRSAKLRFTTGWEYNGYDFTVWWVDLDVAKDGGGYTFRIRDRKISCTPTTRK